MSIVFCILLVIFYAIYLRPNQTNRLFVLNSQTSSLWTFDCSGSMKYIQWLLVRQLANIRIVRLTQQCRIEDEQIHRTNSSSFRTIQINILPLILDESACSSELSRLIDQNSIYFQRKSVRAMLTYQSIDRNQTLANIENDLKRVQLTIDFLSKYFLQTRIIYAEELIHSNIQSCEQLLTKFFSLLQIQLSKEILDADAHLFIEDSLWWDRSDVAERLQTNSLPEPSKELNTTDDFYYLHGHRSFQEYLYRNRRCVDDGLFVQLQSETFKNRTSIRCVTRTFDCAFSDIYSLNDREELYYQTTRKSIKCGFALPSIFDTIRTRFYRNHTCEVVIFTLVTNCYDPLPPVHGNLLSSFCLLAFVDEQTFNAYKTFYPKQSEIIWEIINLGTQATPFYIEAKSTETLKTLGERLFPLAKWIVWVDGKAHVVNLNEILREARTPVLSANHDRPNRTSAVEVNETIIRLTRREKTPHSTKFNHTLRDIRLLEQQYQSEGFYNQSDRLGLRMFDIAILIYRNHHPCIQRYLCGWHNELNYFAYRGQLSLFYSAVRLNLTAYLDYIQSKHYFIFDHKTVC